MHTSVYPFAYGGAVLSLAFVVGQFFAGWCLKQYRYFVDSATYLRQMKATLDRYALSFVLLEGVNNSEEYVAQWKSLRSLIERDISWPHYYGTARPDSNVAKDAADSLGMGLVRGKGTVDA